MEIFLLIAYPALWLAYAALEGTREGYLYAYRDPDDPGYRKDLHPLFTLQRAIVVILLTVPFLQYTGWYFLILAAVAFALVFPLLHDGFYYMTRNTLQANIYTNRFRSDSNTSTAKLSVKSFFQRIYLALAGCIMYGLFVWLTG